MFCIKTLFFEKGSAVLSRGNRLRQVLKQYGYFLLFWFVIQVFYNVPIQNLTSGWTEEILLDLVKTLTWLGVGLTLIYRCSPESLEIAHPFRTNWRFKPLYITLLVMVVYLLIAAFMAHQRIGVVASFKSTMWLQDFLLVGLCEETVFRGYFLNRLRVLLKNDNNALMTQAILFALIHLPRYLTTYPVASFLTILSQLLTVFVLGYLFGWLFLKSRSLWPSIIVHSTWDLLIVMLVGS